MDGHNPYEAPTGALAAGPAPRRRGKRLVVAWVVVFALNLVFPLVVGWGVTAKHGRVGMVVAVLLALAAGCYLCTAARSFAATLTAGAVLVGLSQLVPVLQFIAGALGLDVAQRLGLSPRGDELWVGSELGGFVATVVTGGVLLAASAVVGLVIRLVTPDHYVMKPRPLAV